MVHWRFEGRESSRHISCNAHILRVLRLADWGLTIGRDMLDRSFRCNSSVVGRDVIRHIGCLRRSLYNVRKYSRGICLHGSVFVGIEASLN